MEASVNTKKIAVLIPGYRAQFIDDVIMGLKFQTYKDFDVHISDDSENEVITERLQSLERAGALDGLNVHVYPGPKEPRLNHMQLDKVFTPKYEYIHFHHDDDYIYPTFYEQHLRAHERGDFAVSLSKRWISNDNNIPIDRGLALAVYFDEQNSAFTPLSQQIIAKLCLPISVNCLGELTNALFKSNGTALFPRAPRERSELNYFGLSDIGTFLELAETKNLVAMESYLSNWRKHANQDTAKPSVHGTRTQVMGWLAYAIKAHSDKLITDNDLFAAVEVQKSMYASRIDQDNFFKRALTLICEPDNLCDLKESFTDFWIEFLDNERIRIENYFRGMVQENTQ